MLSIISAGTWLTQYIASISAHCVTAIRSMKRVVSARNAAMIGMKQEGVNGDHDRVEPVPVDRDQDVLQRQDHEEGGDQGIVVCRGGSPSA